MTSRISRPRAALYAAVAALLVLSGAEAALRLAGFSYQPGASYMSFNFPKPGELLQIYEPHPSLLWRMRPGFEFGDGFPPLNAQGFRGPEFKTERSPETLRIACLGDSVTFGRPDADYPSRVAKLLASRLGRPVEALNFGVPGYSSLQGTRLLGRVLAEDRPDLVVILFGWNDHWLAQGYADKDQVVQPAKPETILDPLRGWRLYQLLRRAWDAARTSSRRQPPTLRVSQEDFSANLAAMVRKCREAGSIPILATAPSAIAAGKVPDYLTALGFIRETRDLAELHRLYNLIVRSVADREGVPLVDLDALFAGRDLATLFNDPGQDLIHPNAEGYRLIAQAIADAIEAELGRK